MHLADDPWSVLGLEPGASMADVRAAHRRLAQIFHPDRYQHSPEDVRNEALSRMAQINAAHDAIQARFASQAGQPWWEALRPEPDEAAAAEDEAVRASEAAWDRQDKDQSRPHERQVRPATDRVSLKDHWDAMPSSGRPRVVWTVIACIAIGLVVGWWQGNSNVTATSGGYQINCGSAFDAYNGRVPRLAEAVTSALVQGQNAAVLSIQAGQVKDACKKAGQDHLAIYGAFPLVVMTGTGCYLGYRQLRTAST